MRASARLAMGQARMARLPTPPMYSSEVVNVVLTQKRYAAVALRLVSLVALVAVAQSQLTGCMVIPGSHFSPRGAEKVEPEGDAASLPDSVRVMPITTAFLQNGSNQPGNKNGEPALDDSLASLQRDARSEEHTSELQSRENLVCRLQLEKKK